VRWRVSSLIYIINYSLCLVYFGDFTAIDPQLPFTGRKARLMVAIGLMAIAAIKG
jgi:hypothetical protein